MNVEYLRRCEVCGEAFISAKRNARCCRRHECHAAAAEFTEFITLKGMLSISRWTGGQSQEQLHRQYYAQQLWNAVRRLSHSEDVLAAVLIEILEELSAETPGCPQDRV